MALGLDGNTRGTNNSSDTSIATLSTTNPNDIIIVFASSKNNGHNLVAVSSTNTSGWIDLADANANPQVNPSSVSVWWGQASSILTNESITIQWDSGLVNWVWGVFAVSGANFSTPFDSNASLPKIAYDNASGLPPVASGISTTNSNDLIFAVIGTTQGSFVFTHGANYTIIDTPNQTGISGADEYRIVSTIQSNVSVAFGNNTLGVYTMVVHAIVQAGSAVSVGTILGSMDLTNSTMRF